MGLQENVGVRLAYKANSSGSMTSNAEADTATIPGASGATELRRVSSTLKLTKDTYQSNEVRTDRQIADFRHGVARVQGEISGELSPATYFPFLEAAFRGTKASAVTKSNTEFTSMAADNALSTFTAGGSTWAAQGFSVGDPIQFSTMSDTDNNSKTFVITALAGTVATVTPAPDTMTADTSFTVTRPGKKITVPVSSHVKRLFTFEHYHQDVDITQLFTECRVTGAQLKLPATGMATVSIPITGRGQDVLATSASPYFTSPTAANTNGIAAAVNGKVVHQGVAVGVITGIDINLVMNVEAPAVVGQNFVPEIFLGATKVTGNLTALFEDATFLNAFTNETEVELIVLLTTTSAANSPFISICLPRVKLGGADLALQGEGGLPINCPFTALLKPVTTGYDNTTIAIVDSEAA